MDVTGKHHIDESVKRFHSPLKGFIRKRVPSDEDAEDILQDVFFQLARADSLITPVEQTAAWLFRVARNRITDWWRRKQGLPVEYWKEDALVAELNQVLSNQPDTPEVNYLKELVWQELELCLNELPDEQREAFELNEMYGLSFREISERTGVAEKTLMSRKHYAVLYLRRRLASLYAELMSY